MKQTSLFLLFFTCVFAFAQNVWQPVSSTSKLNFQHQDSACISHHIKVDSVVVSNNDSLFYFNQIAKNVSDPQFPTYWMNQPQFLYQKMRKKANGVYVFEDTINKFTLNTLANLNDNWLFDSVQNITAQVVDIQQQTVLGLTDSVKTIVLSSGDSILLAKNTGLIQLGKYKLVGIQDAGMGIQMPNFHSIYDYQIGDIFYYEASVSSSSAQQYIQRHRKRKLLTKLDTLGGFKYQFEEWRKDSVVTWTGGSSATIHYYHTFPTEYYLPDNTFPMQEDAYPNEVVQAVGSYIGIMEFKKDNDGVVRKGYYKIYNVFNYPVLDPIFSNYYYKEWRDTWGVSYINSYGGNSLFYETLVGGMRDSLKWGISKPDSLYSVAISPQTEPFKVEVFPNPVQDFLAIKMINHSNFEVILTDIQGKEEYRQTYENEPFVKINTQAWLGTYFLIIKMDNKEVSRQILIQR